MERSQDDTTGSAPARNNKRLLELQHAAPPLGEDVLLTYFGHSAFCITAPSGLTVMIDPWRNDPRGGGGGFFFFGSFPNISVDICISTHEHFDHDAVRALDASIVIERPVGKFRIADVTLLGIADKHAIDFAHGDYDIAEILHRTHEVDIRPPNNPRSWDNSLVIVETGGLRILHWGDNRPDPDPRSLSLIADIDILIVPVDDSQHVLSFDAIEKIVKQIKPRIVIPCHYYIPSMTQRYSTLLRATRWLSMQANPVHTDSHSIFLGSVMASKDANVICFGDNVARG